MASAADVREIMGITPLDNTLTKDYILGNDKKRYLPITNILIVI